MAKQSYQWFLEPRNSHTNEVLSNALDGQENFYNNISCADGKRRNLWLCPSGLVFMFWRSRSNSKNQDCKTLLLFYYFLRFTNTKA